ncbi:MAG TPA: HepT-like ribonuclease domain-containing protein [Gaiellaceae bacterium]|nr:HepT-like ribonuclease domain-containing protein [Gaiellaceae bacterium]
MRSDRERLEDILEACESISGEVAPRRDQLESDVLLRLATERLIEIIGEAAANVSPELRAAHPEVDWSQPVGMRNILVHRYFGIDVALLRRAVEDSAPALEAKVRAILEELK